MPKRAKAHSAADASNILEPSAKRLHNFNNNNDDVFKKYKNIEVFSKLPADLDKMTNSFLTLIKMSLEKTKADVIEDTSHGSLGHSVDTFVNCMMGIKAVCIDTNDYMQQISAAYDAEVEKRQKMASAYKNARDERQSMASAYEDEKQRMIAAHAIEKQQLLAEYDRNLRQLNDRITRLDGQDLLQAVKTIHAYTSSFVCQPLALPPKNLNPTPATPAFDNYIAAQTANAANNEAANYEEENYEAANNEFEEEIILSVGRSSTPGAI